jgi:hypothetical protein
MYGERCLELLHCIHCQAVAIWRILGTDLTSMADQSTRPLTLTDGNVTAGLLNVRFSTPITN